MAERKIACLVGRRADWRLLRLAEVALTLDGQIVLTVGCIGPDGPATVNTPEMVSACQRLHFDKIAMSDEVVLVQGDHIGEDTARDLAYATSLEKPIRVLTAFDLDYRIQTAADRAESRAALGEPR